MKGKEGYFRELERIYIREGEGGIHFTISACIRRQVLRKYPFLTLELEEKAQERLYYINCICTV